MIKATENNLIITVTTQYIKNISNILKVAAIENNSNVDSADIVQIVGEVISVPDRITTDQRGYEGFSTKDIRVGDTVIFRFDVIHQFTNISKVGRIFKNMFMWEGKEYWLCDIQKVFGVIRDGEVKMVNGYVMLNDFETSKIVLSHADAGFRGAQSSEVMHIGSSKTNEKYLGIVSRETVYFNSIAAAKYQIKGKPFRVLQQSSILGKGIV